MNVWSRVVDNLPRNKPEFWRDPVSSVRRRLLLAAQRKLDPRFDERPYIAALAHDDLLLEVVPAESIGSAVVTFGVYEYAPTELLRRYLQRGDLFVDVGANLGYYSIVAASCVGVDGRVIAFEPYPEVYARAVRNVALNRFANVEVRPLAVSDREGVAHLLPPSGANAGLGRLEMAPSPQTIEVVATRLDATLSGATPALIKVDVEGHEAAVFAGARDVLEGSEPPAVLFESHELGNDAGLLESLGYQLFAPRLRRGRLQLEPARRSAYYRNWEAPNYLAVRGPRGLSFARELCDPTST